MSSELERFRNHARRMATADHVDDCRGTHPRPRLGGPTDIHPDPDCDGCVTSTDRERWRLLADEADVRIEGKKLELRIHKAANAALDDECRRICDQPRVEIDVTEQIRALCDPIPPGEQPPADRRLCDPDPDHDEDEDL